MLKRLLTYSILSLVALGGFFGNVSNTQYFEVSSLDAATSCGQPGSDPATCIPTGGIAGGTNATTPPSSAMVDKYNSIIDSINIILALVSTLATPVILFVGWLMSPDWTSGDIFQLRTPMYNLWVTVSNIVYFIYAILLILIALGTMIGHATFSYKVMLPKLALGILMVPFTWWFVQWTISLASVVTASVITIPMETIDAMEENKKSDWFSGTPSIPKKITVGSGPMSSSDCKTKPAECVTPKEFMGSSAGMYGPMVVYAYSIFKFDKATRLEGGIDVAKALVQLVHTSLVSAIMFVVFGVLVLALAVMLLVRAIKLWVYAIFSPLFTFQFVAGGAMMGEDKDTFTIREFVGLAFVPAIVGLSLSFGLIMIAAVQGTNSSGTPGATCNLNSAEGCKIADVMGSPTNSITRKWIPMSGSTTDYATTTTFQWGPVGLDFLGSATNQKNTESNTQGALDSLGGAFGTIIIDVIALVFIWLAFMAAKNVSKAVKAAVQPFESIGSQVGKMAMKLPQYTPLPIPGGSISGLAHTAELTKSKIDTEMRKKELSKIGSMFPHLVEGVIKPEDMAKLETAMRDNKNKGIAGLEPITKAIGELTSKGDVDKNIARFEEKMTGQMTEQQIKELLKINKVLPGDKEYEAIIAMLSGKSSTLNSTQREIGWKKMQSWNSSSGGSGTTSGANTIVPKTESGKITEITINNNGTHTWKASDLIPTNIDKIANNLKGSGITEERLTEVMKDTGLKDSAKKIIEKIKELEEKKA